MFRFAGVAVVAVSLSALMFAQDSEKNKNLDIRSSVGDLHMGADADAKKVGVPLYPGARLQTSFARVAPPCRSPWCRIPNF